MSWIFKDKFRTAVLALIIANIIWGAGPPIFKWALEDVGPFTLAFFRFFGAALILLPFAIKHLKVAKQDIKKLLLMAFTGITLNISFFLVGLQHAPSINAGIISSAAPIFIIFGGLFFLREKPKKKTLTGAVIGLIGVMIVVLSPLFKTGVNAEAGDSLVGNFMFIIAMLASIGTYIFGRELMEKYRATTITFWVFTIGAITFFPLFWSEFASNNFVLNLDQKALFGILFGIVFSSAIAYYFVNWALKYMRAGDTGMFIYIDPVVTILIAAPLLGEIPGPAYIFGSILVFSGIYIAEGRLHWHPLHLLRR